MAAGGGGRARCDRCHSPPRPTRVAIAARPPQLPRPGLRGPSMYAQIARYAGQQRNQENAQPTHVSRTLASNHTPSPTNGATDQQLRLNCIPIAAIVQLSHTPARSRAGGLEASTADARRRSPTPCSANRVWQPRHALRGLCPTLSMPRLHGTPSSPQLSCTLKNVDERKKLKDMQSPITASAASMRRNAA